MKGKGNLAAKAGLAAVSAILCLAAGEAAIRVFGLGPEISAIRTDLFYLSPNETLRYEMLPNTSNELYVTNNDGLRDRNFQKEKPPGVFRIACLGDSVCMGYAVSQDQPYSKRLEALLNQYFSDKGLKFEVLNMGVLGYNISQVAENMAVKAIAYQPDVIVYGYCMNDPQDFSFEITLLNQVSKAERKFLYGSAETRFRALKQLKIVLLARYLIESKTRQGERKMPEHLPSRVDPAYAAMKDGTYSNYFTILHQEAPGWPRVTDSFYRMAELSAKNRLPVYVFLFPVMRDLDRYPLKTVHARLCEAVEARNLRACDLQPALAAYGQDLGEKPGLDSLHFSPKGHAFVAMMMLQRLLDDGMIPGFTGADFLRVAGGGDNIQAQLAREAMKWGAHPQGGSSAK